PVVGITCSAGTRIARTQITLRIVARQRDRSGLLNLAKPRPICSVRRDDHPFASQRVESPVRLKVEVRHLGTRRLVRQRLKHICQASCRSNGCTPCSCSFKKTKPPSLRQCLLCSLQSRRRSCASQNSLQFVPQLQPSCPARDTRLRNHRGGCDVTLPSI